ncbi:hypothetical protein N7540_009220 [Penicillium herquei]|nr:hypothetical protein N7540_009220 [Penicillium herquei]
MHKVVVPKNSGVHRFACLALYRALLRQCSPSNGNAPWLTETKFLVRQRFHRYKGLQSPSQAAYSLKAGYKALDLLDSANKGNKQDGHQIIKTLAEAKSMKKAYAAMHKDINKPKPPSPLSPRAARKQETLLFEKQTQRRHPDTPSILSRPNLEISGKRHVPVLVNARGIPFLRLKKPQPKNLSGVIRAKLEKRWHRIVLRDRLQTDLLFAKDEEAWDRITGMKSEPDSGTWSEAVKTSLDYVRTKIVETDQQNREMAEKMWKIVLQERKLTEEDAQKQTKGKSP